MASRKRGTKSSLMAQDAPIPEEAFTSSAGFDFGGPVASPRMTRARRASMSFEVPAKSGKRMSLAPTMTKLKEEAAPRPVNRRRSLAVTAKEPPKPAAGRRRSVAVPTKKGPATLKSGKKAPAIVEADEDLEFIFDPTPSRDITPAKGPRAPGTPSKGIRPTSFYSSPVKAPLKGSLANPLVASPTKKFATATSPTKKFAKNTTRILSDEAIAESLMAAGRVPARTAAAVPAKAKAVVQASPTKKVVSRQSLSRQDIEASLMAEFDRTPTDARILPKTFETDIPRDKVKPRRREVAIQSPVVAAFRQKEPKGSRIKSPPVTPVKAATFVPQILPVGSPVITAIMKEVKKVEVRLTPHRIKEDPNMIFSLLEKEHKSKDRVERVVQELVARTQQIKAKTRKSLDAEAPLVVRVSVPETPTKAKVGRPAKAKPEVESPVVETKKVVTKTVVPPIEETPKAKPGRPPKAKAAEKTPVVKASKTPKAEETPKAKLGRPPKTPVVKISKTPKAEDPPTAMETPKAKVGRPPKVKSEKTSAVKASKAAKTPKTLKRLLEPSHTPVSSSKRLRVEEPEPKFKPARKSAAKVTPLKARYTKPVENLSALKKPLKRLTKVAAVTPAQVVKPSDLLRKNLRRQVETAITAKVAARPDSSPYTMDTTENNSPVFRKVEREAAAVKQHLTGTPARTQPQRMRKFGTGLQPSALALLDRSELPSEGKRQSVSSSTPLRPAACPSSPHPLEAMEATPIRPPPACLAQPLSPPPQMVTGGLGKMCAIM